MFKKKLEFIKYIPDIDIPCTAPVLPTYATSGSSGFDLYSIHDVSLKPGIPTLIHTGWRIVIPNKKYEIQIRPRSGCSLNDGLTVINTPGTIDSDYSGEVCIIAVWSGADTGKNKFDICEVHNIDDDGMGYHGSTNYLYIPAGSRVAQGVLCPIIKPKIVEVEDIYYGNKFDTERSSKGFGSSGVN